MTQPNQLAQLRQDFEALSIEVEVFQYHYHTLRCLYLDPTESEIRQYTRCAPLFFQNHWRLLLERIYLGLRHFTDRPAMRDRENLSFRYFVDEMRGKKDVTNLVAQVDRFEHAVEPIKKTLHRQLGHLDRSIRIGLESPAWLDPPDFETACSSVMEITNQIALLGWGFAIGHFHPDSSSDLSRLKAILRSA